VKEGEMNLPYWKHPKDFTKEEREVYLEMLRLIWLRVVAPIPLRYAIEQMDDRDD
jgi:hypothetical protein